MYEIIDFINGKKFNKNLPLVIGFFDGLHRGHEQLFASLSPRCFNILTFCNIPSKNSTFITTQKKRLKQLMLLSPCDIYL
jgi:FAD synthase